MLLPHQLLCIARSESTTWDSQHTTNEIIHLSSHVRNTLAAQSAPAHHHHCTNTEVCLGEGRNLITQPEKTRFSLFDQRLLDENAVVQSLNYFEWDVLELIRPAKFRECNALGREIHNHLLPQNRLAPELD